MKVIAWYLPQFHEIEENNKWWGKGFTEWTNVKKSKSLYRGHNQPREPLNDNYYDLSEVKTLEWQADLAKKYGIFGFCFYHYWFDGDLLLQKPMEILLRNKEIDINYCISWANEPWTRSWDGKNSKILKDQKYGNEKNWEKHFCYLLPFFLDERYIKVENKPMMLIYKTQSIPNCNEMMNYFIRRAMENGFDGIHFIETIRDKNCDERNIPISGRVEFEPSRTLSHLPIVKWKNRFRRTVIIFYNKVFKRNKIGNKVKNYSDFFEKACKIKPERNTYPGVFVGWDNSPRRGANATVFEKNPPEMFKRYLDLKMSNSELYKTEFTFINAWNEWAEGAYLEPDKKYGYEYLEVISEFNKKYGN